MSVGELPYLDRARIGSLVTMSDAVTALRQAFTLGVSHPPRTAIEVDGADLLVMPAAAGSAAGVKLIMVQPANASRGEPVIQGMYVLFDAAHGRPVALLDGGALTALRTPAISALTTAALAPEPCTGTIVVGGGPQGIGHLIAMRAVLPALQRQVLVTRSGDVSTPVDADVEVRAIGDLPRLMAEMAGDGLVINACTSSVTPVLLGAEVPDGVHVNLVGSYRAGVREADGALIERASVYVDDRAAARHEAGDLIGAANEGWDWSTVLGDLTDLASGRARRTDAAEVTLFKSVGLAIEDLVIARLAFTRAGL
ncbi:MAG: ornithine cyclodeaminase family protein [Acidimicrobiia bacterium]